MLHMTENDPEAYATEKTVEGKNLMFSGLYLNHPILRINTWLKVSQNLIHIPYNQIIQRIE